MDGERPRALLSARNIFFFSATSRRKRRLVERFGERNDGKLGQHLTGKRHTSSASRPRKRWFTRARSRSKSMRPSPTERPRRLRTASLRSSRTSAKQFLPPITTTLHTLPWIEATWFAAAKRGGFVDCRRDRAWLLSEVTSYSKLGTRSGPRFAAIAWLDLSQHALRQERSQLTRDSLPLPITLDIHACPAKAILEWLSVPRSTNN